MGQDVEWLPELGAMSTGYVLEWSINMECIKDYPWRQVSCRGTPLIKGVPLESFSLSNYGRISKVETQILSR